MDYPKGRECVEKMCHHHAGYGCALHTNADSTWSDCPRARSARLAKATAACEKLVAWDRGGGVLDRSLCEACSLAREVVRDA
jgi:hypothetical protein